MITIEAFHCVAALTRFALVTARSVIVIEVGAARALEKITSHGGHVADLRGSSGEDRACQHRITHAHCLVLGEGGVADAGADQQSAIFALLDCGRQPRHVNECGWPLQVLAHQINQIGAASQILGADGRSQTKRFGGVAGVVIGERVHSAASA